MQLTKNEKIEELLFFYTKEQLEEKLNIPLSQIKENSIKLKSIFNKHLEEYSENVNIESIFDSDNSYMLIDTPDGYSPIGELFIKNRDCIEIILEDSIKIKCSIDHLIETNNGWKHAANLSEYDLVYTKNGFVKFKNSKKIDDKIVYDIEVLTSNHRYWSNNISSHNSSKTFTAVYAALKLYAEKKIDKIILTKPIQESGEKLGFLPGTVSEKIDPFMESFISNAQKMIDPQSLGFLISSNIIEFRPLAYMRGATFDNCIMILDEAQNCDFRQLMLFITRMGQGSKVVITGDVSQYDIAKNRVALPAFIELIQDIKGVSKHVFDETDIVRSKILQDVVKCYEKWRETNDKV